MKTASKTAASTKAAAKTAPAAKVAAETKVIAPKKAPPFAFSFVTAGHYDAPNGISLKRLESGEWLLTQKQGARVKKIGTHKNVYDGIRAGKDFAGVAYDLPAKTAAKQAQKASAPAPATPAANEGADKEADVEI
jgi:hypothetical protein